MKICEVLCFAKVASSSVVYKFEFAGLESPAHNGEVAAVAALVRARRFGLRVSSYRARLVGVWRMQRMNEEIRKAGTEDFLFLPSGVPHSRCCAAGAALVRARRFGRRVLR